MSFFQLRKKVFQNGFSKLHLKDLNYYNNSYHEIIDDYSDKIIKLYEKEKEFSDIMPEILKGKRANFLYKRLIYKGMKFQTPFMKALRRTIQEIEAKSKLEVRKDKFLGFYKLSKLNLAKLKLKRLEKTKNLKLNDLKIVNENKNSEKNLIRSFSDFNLNLTTKAPKFILNSSLNDSNYSFNNKNLNVTNQSQQNMSKSPNNKELSTYYKSDTNFKNLSYNSFSEYTKKFNKPIYIIDKCLEEIELSNIVNDNVTKIDEKISRNIKKQIKTIEYMKKTDMLNLDTFKIKKYQQMEKNNMDEIKKKLNEKISDSYAYNNRKKFKEQIKNSEGINACYIYLHDVEKTNNILEGKRKLIKRKINKIENFCEHEYDKAEYLKKRVLMLNKKNKSENKIKKIKIKDDLFMTNKKIDDDNPKLLNGGFLPKLLELKKKFINEIHVVQPLKKKNRINYL